MRNEFYAELMAGKSLDCPCCDRFAKVYDRPLNSSMAWVLIWLWRVHGTNWVKVLTEMKESNLPNAVVGDFPKLRHWYLLEKHPEEVGVYRVSEHGALFVLNKLKVRRSYLTYHKKVLSYRGPKIGIQDALGDQFDYDELMLPATIIEPPTLFSSIK